VIKISTLRNKYLNPYARKLRKNMTKEEKRLWYDFLKKLPVKFKRQMIINNYIVDFICSKEKLVIEVDGEQHVSEIENRYFDEKRDEYLNTLGLKVLRIPNKDINKNFEGVCIKILKHLPREYTVKMYGENYAKMVFFKIEDKGRSL
jgi:very-short-patch-repair endonuclease